MGLLVVACTVPAMLVASYLIVDSYATARANAERDILATTRALMQAVDADLLGAQSGLRVLATSPYLRSDNFADFREAAREVLPGLPGNGIVLVDAAGQLVMSTLVPYGQPLPKTGIPDLVRTVFESARPAISDFYIGATSKQPQVAVGVPVVRNGKVAYALVMGLLPAHVAGILERQKIPEGWIVAILDSGGTIVARTKTPELFIGKKGTAEFRRQTLTAQEGIYETPTLEGVAVIGGFHRSSVTGWMIAFGVPKNVFTTGLQRQLTIDIAATVLVLLLGAVLAGSISWRIGRSIQAMETPALALGSSEKIDVPTVEIREVNELGQALARASQLIGQRERERDQAALQRAQMEDSLRQSQKLEALGQMAATIAHDFGNLLTPILGNLEMLEKGIDDPRSRSRIKSALAGAKRGEKLVRSLMAFARREPLAMTTIDVNQSIWTMEELLKEALETTGKLVFNPAPEAWPARGDPSQLGMAMLNLVVNARDAMTARGTVRISTKNTTLHGEIDNLSGDYVAIAVSDTGSGMPAETLALAFEPLFTTKGPGKGTGLGLASVYGFARQCGGSAVIESELRKGTTVTIYLPRAQRAGTEIGGPPDGHLVETKVG
ncbi:MAG TPA: ATP-binding protein [Pirellulales bacterium]|nr:ATP-binding protein [Pirellulales bacterium]